MAEHTEKKCPKCGQILRFPKNIGGMLMACPSCGNKFHSDFKLGGTRRSEPEGMVAKVFGMPYDILSRFCRYFRS
jgi:DNA-directed RNA polymerase subunit RPC12/RpoP